MAGEENWLELKIFDNERFDDYCSQEWMQKARQASLKREESETDENNFGRQEIRIRVWAIRSGENVGICKAIIESYDPVENEFEGVWEDTLQRERFKRVEICFETEDPEKYIARLLDAIERRKTMATRLKYQHYVDSMPIEELNEMETEQKER